MLLLSALCLLTGVPVPASADEGTGSGSGSGTSTAVTPPTPADPETMATGIHPDLAYTPEICGRVLIIDDGTSRTDRLTDACYGAQWRTPIKISYPKYAENRYYATYYHFFSSEELYFCTKTTDSDGNTVTTALTQKPQDAGNYSLCINQYGAQNFQNGVNLYRKLEDYPDASQNK